MGLVGAKCTARQTGMGSGSASRIYLMSSERSKKDAKFASYSRISPSSNLEPGTTDRNFPSSGTSYSTLPGSVPPVYKSTQGLGSNIPCTEVHETLYFRLDAVVSQSYSTPRGGDTVSLELRSFALFFSTHATEKYHGSVVLFGGSHCQRVQGRRTQVEAR